MDDGVASIACEVKKKRNSLVSHTHTSSECVSGGSRFSILKSNTFRVTREYRVLSRLKNERKNNETTTHSLNNNYFINRIPARQYMHSVQYNCTCRTVWDETVGMAIGYCVQLYATGYKSAHRITHFDIFNSFLINFSCVFNSLSCGSCTLFILYNWKEKK